MVESFEYLLAAILDVFMGESPNTLSVVSGNLQKQSFPFTEHTTSRPYFDIQRNLLVRLHKLSFCAMIVPVGKV
jgi:hypothetical protein